MSIKKIAGSGFVVFNVVVVPAEGLVVEPGAIKPVTRRTTLAASPFLIGFGNRPGSVGRIVNPLSVVSVILVVLVFNSRKSGWRLPFDPESKESHL